MTIIILDRFPALLSIRMRKNSDSLKITTTVIFTVRSSQALRLQFYKEAVKFFLKRNTKGRAISGIDDSIRRCANPTSTLSQQ